MKTLYILMGLVLIVVVGGAFFAISKNLTISKVKEATSVAENVSENETTVEKGNSDVSINNDEVSSRYVDYSSENIEKATAGEGKVVLFFAALAWCPSCQVADKDLRSNLDKLPSDITILRVDYDTAKDLKQKYAITMQDTFVQIDDKGKEITRWNSGGLGVEALLANAK